MWAKYPKNKLDTSERFQSKNEHSHAHGVVKTSNSVFSRLSYAEYRKNVLKFEHKLQHDYFLNP